MLRRPTLVALAIALVVPLAACVEQTRIPDAEPSSDVAPLFASDEEALAAATAAYEEYLAASNAVTSSADLAIEPILNLVTPDYLLDEREALKEFESRDLRTRGDSAVVGATLQQRFEGEDRATNVVMYVCVDVSAVRVLDSSGIDVTPADRPNTAALEVEMVSQAERPTELLVNRSTPWRDSSICG